MEENILARIRSASASRGWKRPSGIKIAPLKILAGVC